MRNNEHLIWWEIRDRDAWNRFEAWLDEQDKLPRHRLHDEVNWFDCERCLRDTLFRACMDGLSNPDAAFTLKANKIQWSMVDREPTVLTLRYQ
jgi:hypothetical protein